MTILLPQGECVRNVDLNANSNSSWRGAGLLIGGVLLIGLASAINIRHAIGTTTNFFDIAEAASLALAMTFGLVILPGLGIQKAREGARWLAFGAYLGALICGAVSFTNLVGSAMKHRLTAAIEATETIDRRKVARSDIEKAQRELATIGTTRPSATIQGEIDAKLTSRNDLEGCEAKWLVSSKARSVCIDVNQLRAEKGVADRQAALEGTITTARAKLGTTDAGKAIGSADTATVVAAATKLGWTVEGETVDLLKDVGTAFGVELFASLLIAGWSSTGRTMTAANTILSVETLPALITPNIETVQIEPVSSPSVLTERPDRTKGEDSPETGTCAARQRIIDRLKENAGSVRGSQRSLAKDVGVSPSRFNAVLRDMAERGVVSVRTGATGTVVTLA